MSDETKQSIRLNSPKMNVTMKIIDKNKNVIQKIEANNWKAIE